MAWPRDVFCQWELAEAQTALLLVSADQAAHDDWKWQSAWLLSLLPDPPFHLLVDTLGGSLSRPTSKLADPSWVGAAVAFSKDMATLQEAKKAKGGISGGDRQSKNPKGGGQGAAAKDGDVEP